MSDDVSAQEAVTPPSAADPGGAHAVGPDPRPVPVGPASAAPEIEAQLMGAFVARAHQAIDQIVASQSSAVALQGAASEWRTEPAAVCRVCHVTFNPADSGHVCAEPPAAPEIAAERPAWSRRIPGKDKVAIVGFSTHHRHLAPVDDPTYEIWGLNNAYVHLNRADRWFELHSEDQYGWDLRRPGDHVGWLKKFAGPLYLIQARADLPNSIAYPYHEVIECVGPYLTSGPALMLGLAILEGFRHISIYGIDLSTNTEYAQQRPGFEFLIGLAMGREITIEMPRACELLKGPIYGRGDLNEGGEHHTRKQFEGRLAALAARKREALAELRQHELTVARIEGAELESKYWIGQTPEGADQNRMLAQMAGAGKAIVEAKGEGGIGALRHPTGDLADPLAARGGVGG